MTSLADRLAKLDAAATPGPWAGESTFKSIVAKKRKSVLASIPNPHNLALVSALRNHTPQIIRALRLLERAEPMCETIEGVTKGRYAREWLAEYHALVAEMEE